MKMEWDSEIICIYEQLYRQILKTCAKFGINTTETTEIRNKVHEKWRLQNEGEKEQPKVETLANPHDIFDGQVPQSSEEVLGGGRKGDVGSIATVPQE